MAKMKIIFFVLILFLASTSVTASISIATQTHSSNTPLDLRTFVTLNQLYISSLTQKEAGLLGFRTFNRYPALTAQIQFHDSSAIMSLLINTTNPIGHCTNGLLDGDEIEVDCGGICQACVSCDNRRKDGDEEGVDCGGSCPSCVQLKILAVPLNWEGTQAEFDNAADAQIDFFIDAISLKNCPERIRVEKLDATKYNFDNFSCTRKDCGVGKIKPFIEQQGIDVKNYDHIIGFIENSPCSPIAGCSNGKDAAWVETEYGIVAAHEIGHFYGLEDEYCSNQAGSGHPNCNDGNEWWRLFNIIPMPPTDINYLDDRLGCNASIGYCCSDCSASANPFGKGDYFICCEGNMNDLGGRSIMSYANAAGPRAFDNHSKEHLASFPKLSCPVQAKAMPITAGPVAGKIIDLNLKIFENDSVQEQYTHLVDGEGNTYINDTGNYNILIKSIANVTIFNYSFVRYFDYEGPMLRGVNYSALNLTSFELALKIPYDNMMHMLYVKHENITIFSTLLNFCNQDGVCNGSETYLSCWQDCRPYSQDGLCINKSGDGCDPDCAEGVDDDCGIPFTMSLAEGWNLVSIPLDLNNHSASKVFNNTNITIFGYKNNSWFVPKEFEAKLGYWVKLNQSLNLIITGTEVTDKTINLTNGWNLIGYSYLNETGVNDSVLKNYTVFAYIHNSWFSYNPSRINFLNNLETLLPGYGYWVYTNSTLTI